MKQICSTNRGALRARAHGLRPVVILGDAGLTAGVMAEIDRCLEAHELIKIRVLGDDRRQRVGLIARICELTGASPVQHIGKILVIYRAKPAASFAGTPADVTPPPRGKPCHDHRAKPARRRQPVRPPKTRGR